MIERIHNFCIIESMWHQMLEGYSRKLKFVLLEMYIIKKKGLMWNSILEILEEKAAQGVEVKLLYDSGWTGSLAWRLPSSFK